ncbi:MAG: DUF5337 domain-containing protein [Shimia sp.]
MALSRDVELALSRQGRTASVVIAGTMVLWLAAQWIGPALGLHGNYVFLVDFAALAALFWALVVAARIWRRRREAER